MFGRSLVFCLFLIVTQSAGLPSQLKIGGLFAADEGQQELVFKFAIDKINSEASLFPSSTLSPVIERIGNNDSFHTDKKGEYLNEDCYSIRY